MKLSCEVQAVVRRWPVRIGLAVAALVVAVVLLAPPAAPRCPGGEVLVTVAPGAAVTFEVPGRQCPVKLVLTTP